MSCLGKNYNPIPPREWSRFENYCAYHNTPVINKVVYVPLLKQYISVDSLSYQLSMLKKGNILQYKKNSANITKNQRYSQIARGSWTNRTTTWATQSDSYTNPNTNSLKRINYSTIITNPSQTATSNSDINVTNIDNVFCGGSNIPSQNGFVPSTNSGGNSNQPILPPITPIQSSTNPIIPTIKTPAKITEIQIPNGGNMICNISENSCTGQIYSTKSISECNPLSASDVPGPVNETLCYNDALPTYYPRNRITYNAGGNKWPVGSKFILPA